VGRSADHLATDPGDALAARRRLYLSTIASSSSSGTQSITLHGVDIDAFTLTPWSLAWPRSLGGKGVGTKLHDMRVADGALYVAGSANDPDKGSPIGGVYWTSGLAARLSLTGDLVWTRVTGATGHSDMFWGLGPTPDAVLAIGQAAAYIGTSGHAFGYGWIARLGLADGGTRSSLMFGDPGFGSAFCAGAGQSSALQVGGWTEHRAPDGSYRAWSCVVDAGPRPLLSRAGSPARARAGDTSVGEPGPRGPLPWALHPRRAVQMATRPTPRGAR
jgi:hypothetical protein